MSASSTHEVMLQVLDAPQHMYRLSLLGAATSSAIISWTANMPPLGPPDLLANLRICFCAKLLGYTDAFLPGIVKLDCAEPVASDLRSSAPAGSDRAELGGSDWFDAVGNGKRSGVPGSERRAWSGIPLEDGVGFSDCLDMLNGPAESVRIQCARSALVARQYIR